MPMTDPLGDMLTRIRNGQQARKDSILTPASKLRAHVLDVLQREGYIRGYREESLGAHAGLRLDIRSVAGQAGLLLTDRGHSAAVIAVDFTGRRVSLVWIRLDPYVLRHWNRV